MTGNQVFWGLLVTAVMALAATKEWRRNWRLAVLLAAIPVFGWLSVLFRDVETSEQP